jgi:hypothetical protein
MNARRLCTLVLGGVIWGCGDDPVSPLPSSIVTDAASYVAAPGIVHGIDGYVFTVIARFTNRSKHTVYLGKCYQDFLYPVYGVGVAGRDTSAAYDPGWDCVGGLYFAVGPGMTRVDTLRVASPNAFDQFGLIGVLEGRFFLSYEIYGCADETAECRQPLHAVAHSNVFRVRLDQ